MKNIRNFLLVVIGIGVPFAQSNAEQLLANVNSIDVVMSQAMSYSIDSQEGEQQIDAGESLSINVNQRVVLRSGSKKISFSPLDNRIADANGEFLSDNAMRAAGFELPSKFRAVSILHLSVETSSTGPLRTCEVLVLEDLLDSAGIAELDALLVASDLTSSQRNGLRSISCATQ